MTGILDKYGRLKIERCGDWCPLFSEPLNTSGSDIPEKVTLQLCNGKTLTFDTFADDRLMR